MDHSTPPDLSILWPTRWLPAAAPAQATQEFGIRLFDLDSPQRGIVHDRLRVRLTRRE
jgi:hypothetical protein